MIVKSSRTFVSSSSSGSGGQIHSFDFIWNIESWLVPDSGLTSRYTHNAMQPPGYGLMVSLPPGGADKDFWTSWKKCVQRSLPATRSLQAVTQLGMFIDTSLSYMSNIRVIKCHVLQCHCQVDDKIKDPSLEICHEHLTFYFHVYLIDTSRTMLCAPHFP